VNKARMLPLAVVATSTLVWGGCGGSDTTGPGVQSQTGLIQVSTSTSGVDLDPDGYAATLDGGAERAIGPNGVTTFSDVAVGSHQVALTGLADNCSVSGDNPGTVAVAGGETAQVSFLVSCEVPQIGSLEVTTTVTNNFDPDGFMVNVAGVGQGSVDVDGRATFDDLASGSQLVELQDIAPNCSVEGDNPATVTIPAGGSATHAFAVTCNSPPDGRMVYLDVVAGKEGIVVMNSDGSGKLLVRECQPSWCASPVWSPDGSRIAFLHMENGWLNLWTIGRDGSDPVRLTDYDGDDGRPEWSPDGTRIAFHREVGDRFMIHLVDADGTNLTRLEPPGDYSDALPTWSTDATRIACQRYTDSSWIIFVMDADGTNGQEVTTRSLQYSDGWPDWSPDGNAIAFERYDSSDGWGVYSVHPDGTNLVYLTSDLQSAGEPSWSPDAARIVFHGSSAGPIYTMNADGSDTTEISSSGTQPDWGP